MPLNDLSLDELTEIAGTLDQIRDAGVMLAAYGLNPTFNLTPGQNATIALPFAMPDAPGRATKADVERIEAKLDLRLEALEETIETNGLHLLPTPSTEAAQPEPALEPVEPPAVEGQVGGTLSAEPSRPDDAAAPPPAVTEASPPPLAEAASTEAEAESGGGQAKAAAAPPAAPAEPGTHQRGFQAGPSWTAKEDDRLIEIVVELVRLGETKKTAIAAAARTLGRPKDGTAFRCHHKLKPRIDAALTAAAMHQAQTEPAAPEIPASPAPANATDGPTASDGDAAVGDETPAAVQEPDLDVDKLRRARDLLQSAEVEDEEIERLAEVTPPEEIERIADTLADPLQAHIASLPYRDGWTMERDVEFLELKGLGWNENEIALEMKLQARLLRPRLDLLTGAYQDDKGKLQRRFGHVEVFAALQARLTGKAA